MHMYKCILAKDITECKCIIQNEQVEIQILFFFFHRDSQDIILWDATKNIILLWSFYFHVGVCEWSDIKLEVQRKIMFINIDIIHLQCLFFHRYYSVFIENYIC